MGILARFHLWWLKGFDLDETTPKESVLHYDASKAGLCDIIGIISFFSLVFSPILLVEAFIFEETEVVSIASVVLFSSIVGLYYANSKDPSSLDNPQCELPMLVMPKDESSKKIAKPLDSTLESGFDILETFEGTLEDPSETLEMPGQTLEKALERPRKEDLDALKNVLGISKGCVQFKKHGGGVYLVVYNSEKKGYDWKRLGTWEDLRSEISNSLSLA